MSKRIYGITLPIAGHAYVELEAESKEAAIEAAFNEVTLDKIENWEALNEFNSGNVCRCPSPWEVTADDLGEADEPASVSKNSEER